MDPNPSYFWFLDDVKFELSYCYAGQWVRFNGLFRSSEVQEYWAKFELDVFSKQLKTPTSGRVLLYKGVPLHDVIQWRVNYYDRPMASLSIRTERFTVYESHEDP